MFAFPSLLGGSGHAAETAETTLMTNPPQLGAWSRRAEMPVPFTAGALPQHVSQMPERCSDTHCRHANDGRRPEFGQRDNLIVNKGSGA